MASRIDLYDGKYTVIDELFEGGGFRALRHGEEWRSLAGDKLVYAMFCEIERLRDELTETHGHYKDIIEALEDDIQGYVEREWGEDW